MAKAACTNTLPFISLHLGCRVTQLEAALSEAESRVRGADELESADVLEAEAEREGDKGAKGDVGGYAAVSGVAPSKEYSPRVCVSKDDSAEATEAEVTGLARRVQQLAEALRVAEAEQVCV